MVKYRGKCAKCAGSHNSHKFKSGARPIPSHIDTDDRYLLPTYNETNNKICMSCEHDLREKPSPVQNPHITLKKRRVSKEHTHAVAAATRGLGLTDSAIKRVIIRTRYPAYDYTPSGNKLWDEELVLGLISLIPCCNLSDHITNPTVRRYLHIHYKPPNTHSDCSGRLTLIDVDIAGQIVTYHFQCYQCLGHYILSSQEKTRCEGVMFPTLGRGFLSQTIEHILAVATSNMTYAAYDIYCAHLQITPVPSSTYYRVLREKIWPAVEHVST